MDGGVAAPPCGAAITDAGETRPDASGTYFAEVTANGTGCPEGTWRTRISPDGLVFTTTFSAYELTLRPTDTQVVKDCQLAIKLHSPEGRSYSMQSFFYGGYALLDEGAVGRQQASYYFQGQPVEGKSVRMDLTGPFDDDFVFSDEVPTEDTVWSPCGVERDLNVTTRVLLQSETAGPTAYMNLLSTDGTARLVFRIASRDCDEAAPP